MEDLDSILTSTEVNGEENLANLFAGAALLGQSPDALARRCIEESGYNLRYLKRTVQNVADSEGVPVDVLANCVAYTVSQEGENWWGTAQNLQERSDGIQYFAINVLLDNIDLSQVSGLDLDLLRRSILISNS